jgi:hypothetical protein
MHWYLRHPETRFLESSRMNSSSSGAIALRYFIFSHPAPIEASHG